MTLVVDASVVVATLVDSGPTGRWAGSVVESCELTAPHLMPVEVANVLRRAAAAGEISADVGPLAHSDLLWELRANLSAYDA